MCECVRQVWIIRQGFVVSFQRRIDRDLAEVLTKHVRPTRAVCVTAGVPHRSICQSSSDGVLALRNTRVLNCYMTECAVLKGQEGVEIGHIYLIRGRIARPREPQVPDCFDMAYWT